MVFAVLLRKEKTMIQTQDLQLLYNTMKDIETKGESTKVMADCLRFIEQKIQESQTPAPIPAPEPVDMPAEAVVDVVDSDQTAE